MRLELDVRSIRWPLREPFRIARGEMTEVEGILVTVTNAAGQRGRGEAYGMNYEGESPASMLRDIARVREGFLSNPNREALLGLLPHGGARCALDCALWDLEAKQSNTPAWRLAGVESFNPVVSAYTIGLRPLSELAPAVAARAAYPLLKIKVSASSPLETLQLVRATAPRAQLIVDPNQSWSFEELRRYAPVCRDLGVVLLEQPLAGNADDALLDYDCPVPLCADEIVHDSTDLPRVVGKYTFVNIKLDKAGGLTAALRLAREARAAGLRLMVGCMAGSSLAMAPAAIVSQLCELVDLDGPLLQAQDWPDPLRYEQGVMSMPTRELWG